MELTVQKLVEHILRAHDFFCSARTLLVACSGGTDSLALLDTLDTLRRTEGPQLICAHYEHGIRGEDSLADAHFVEAFCRAREIPFVCGAGDVPAYARAHRFSPETAARVCRYDFLHRVQTERGCDALVLAHHADDLAETVLMRVLLAVTRAEIEAYVVERGLMPRHDTTNDAMDARRNRIRHELLPQLARTYNPAVRDALTRLSVLAAEEDDFLGALARTEFESAAHPEGLSLAVLRTLHPAMQRRVLRLFWAQRRGAGFFLSPRGADACAHLCRGRGTR